MRRLALLTLLSLSILPGVALAQDAPNPPPPGPPGMDMPPQPPGGPDGGPGGPPPGFDEAPPGPSQALIFKPAKRERIGLIIGLSGPSWSGR